MSGGKTAAFAAMLLAWGTHVVTLDEGENAALIALGAQPLGPTGVAACQSD